MGKKDVRYQFIKMLIEANEISEFKQIFKYLPRTTLAKELGKNSGRMESIIENVGDLRFADIYKISQLIEVSHHIVIALIANQYLNTEKREPGASRKNDTRKK